MILDIYDFYDKMERNHILLSFKGDITSELLTSILQIMESKLENLQEEPKVKKKVYNVLVECLQNLYHHMDEVEPEKVATPDKTRSAIFMIGKNASVYTIITGNYIRNENVKVLQDRLEEINTMDQEQIKEYYKKILANGEISEKGGGGLGMVDIARKTGKKLNFSFMPIDIKYSFFSLNIKIS